MCTKGRIKDPYPRTKASQGTSAGYDFIQVRRSILSAFAKLGKSDDLLMCSTRITDNACGWARRGGKNVWLSSRQQQLQEGTE